MSNPVRHRGGRVVGSEGYSKADTQALLQCVRVLLPTDTRGWETVLDLYRETHARPNKRAQRDIVSLKKKFKTVLNTKRTAEDEYPPEVAEAREVQALIDGKRNEPPQPEASNLKSNVGLPKTFSLHSSSYGDSDGSDPGGKDDDDTEEEKTPSEHEHSMIRAEDHQEVVQTAVPSENDGEITSPRPAQHEADGEPTAAAAKRRRTLVDAGNDQVETPPLAQAVASSEGFLRWQLASEIAERQRLQRQVDGLRDRIEDLKDNHRRELESARAPLADKLETLKDKNLQLALENNRLQTELITTRAATQRPVKP